MTHPRTHSQPTAFCLKECFCSLGTQPFSKCGEGSLGVPKTLSGSSHDDLPFSPSSHVRVKSLKSSLIGIQIPHWSELSEPATVSFGVASKKIITISQRSPFPTVCLCGAEFSSETSNKTKYHTDWMQKQLWRSRCLLLGQPFEQVAKCEWGH